MGNSSPWGWFKRDVIDGRFVGVGGHLRQHYIYVQTHESLGTMVYVLDPQDQREIMFPIGKNWPSGRS